MTEWGVVGVIVVLIGLLAAVVGPILKLNTSIVRLTDEVGNIMVSWSEFKQRYVDHLHELKHADEKMQDELNDHETRISILETKHEHE